MLRRYAIGPLLLAGLWAAPAPADDPPSDVIVISRCPVSFERSALLGAAQPGVLEGRGVEIGDRVKAGQVLGHLRDGEVRAERDLKELVAQSDVSIRTAEAKHAQALSKLRTAETLKGRNYVSLEAFNQLKLDVDTAALEVEAAKQTREQAKLQVRQMEEMIRAREFICPFDGVVVDILKAPGESIGLNDPVFRVIDPSRLRVTGHLDVADAWRVRPGQRARFVPEIGGADLPIEGSSFVGRIIFVDAEIDSGSQTCRILAEIENPKGLLRAGMEGRLEVESQSHAASDKPADAPPPAGVAAERAVTQKPPSPARPAARPGAGPSNPGS